MANVQKQFEAFHDTIRFDYGITSELAEKRDVIVKRIREYLKKNDLPSFTVLLQGSYKMGMGVRPISDLEYDIDVGLRFSFNKDEYDAAAVRGWVLKAVEDHTKHVEDKGPCVRVCYEKGYHVDLVTYAVSEDVSGQEKYSLAHKSTGWKDADPPGLARFVEDVRRPYENTTDAATKTDQFRRVVRYLKRWSDIKLPGEPKPKPSGLALVLLCSTRLSPTTVLNVPDDRRALENLAESVSFDEERITAFKPTPEYEDMFDRLNDGEMVKMKERFREMRDVLRAADAEPDPVLACKTLQTIFGDDFSVPSPEDTAQKTSGPAITTSSTSA
jgi:hypothetical protein